MRGRGLLQRPQAKRPRPREAPRGERGESEGSGRQCSPDPGGGSLRPCPPWPQLPARGRAPCRSGGGESAWAPARPRPGPAAALPRTAQGTQRRPVTPESPTPSRSPGPCGRAGGVGSGPGGQGSWQGTRAHRARGPRAARGRGAPSQRRAPRCGPGWFWARPRRAGPGSTERAAAGAGGLRPRCRGRVSAAWTAGATAAAPAPRSSAGPVGAA